MNSIWNEADLRVERYQELKTQLLKLLEDKDLDFNLGGESQTLGRLCLELGEIEYVYIESFKRYCQVNVNHDLYEAKYPFSTTRNQ